jgi:hypothetical protein
MEIVMKKFAIFQLPSEHDKMRDLYFMEPSEIESLSDEFEFVAQIDARSIDECFRIGNFVCAADEPLRQVVAEGMRSISTGDIVQDLDTNETFLCVSHGWVKINMKECA